MNKKYLLLWVLLFPWTGWSQAGKPVHPKVIKYPIGFAVTPSLRDKPIVTDFSLDNEEFYLNKHEEREIDKSLPIPNHDSIYRNDPYRMQARPAQVNTVQPDIIHHFAGQNSGYYPPDANGDVNADYYFQVVNTTYAIYDKDGNRVAGPSDLNSIFDPNLPGADCNDGDPIVLWDEQANKWFYAEFSLCGNNDYMLIAVSQTADPTGAWWSWSYDVDDTPDYMKFGIWEDGYYMATNTGNGNDVYVFDRQAMIRGDQNPAMIGFDNPNRPGTFDGFHCIMPFDNDGPWAPNGTPGQFITVVDDDQNNPADQLWLYTLQADWQNPQNSTFQRVQTIDIPAFTGNFNDSWDNIPQPGTNQKLDAVSTVLMFRAVYRNFNGDERLVVAHTIAQSQTEGAIRWYELQNNGNGWHIRQGGEVDINGTSCWLPGIAINARKEIAIGYSVSDGNNTYPGIRIIGQTREENNNANGVLDVEETLIWDGDNAQTRANRWGDYAGMSVDPNGKTFWFTTEYMGNSTHGTRIVAFEFPENCQPPSTQATGFSVDAVTDNSMDISWTRGNGDRVLVVARQGSAVNTDPSSGTAYAADAQFGSGDEIGTGNFVVYNGTGTSVTVTGLQAGTTYYFAVYEYAQADNCYLTPALTGDGTTAGPPTVRTLAMQSIGATTATARGEVVSENGSAVTERGVCWGTSPNPTVAGNHAQSGSGTGTYSVNLTGLTASTTYYVRAYAVNAYGTSYGDNVRFRTSCGLITDFPYLENFNSWTLSNPGFDCTADGSVALDDCWENVQGDDADWDVYAHSTPSSGTGPYYDANEWDGTYLYLEASGCSNKTASIVTSSFDFSSLLQPELRFNYHMNGDDMGTLSVSVSTDGGATWSNTLWSVNGNQGSSWHEAIVDLSAYAGQANIMIRFTGATGDSYLSDMAIDNVIIQEASGQTSGTVYCQSNGNYDYDTAINLVQFNDILLNTGGKIYAYNDYTQIKTGLKKGETYPITVNVNTDGNYRVYVRAFIDWNQDGDFDDPGETYDLGYAVDTDNGPTNDAPVDIIVPQDAKLGLTRLRVSAKYNAYPEACETNFDGEVEDYGVVVYDRCNGIVQWNGNLWKTFGRDTLELNELNDKFLYIDNLLYQKSEDLDACGAANRKGNTVVIGSDHYMQLTSDLYNDGYLEVRNNASLVQTDDAGTIDGNGIFVMKRTSDSLANEYDYVYWSTPLQDGFTFGELVPGAWGYYAFDATRQVANTNPNPGWTARQASDTLRTGHGYAVSAPNGFTGGVLNAVFRKDHIPFNNGSMQVPVYINGQGGDGGDDWNLLGNPYPSALDFDQLVQNNPAINGSLYLWTNCAGLDSQGRHQERGYSVYNRTGSVAACSGNGAAAGQYVASGQGFMVEALQNAQVTFSNAYRSPSNDGFLNRRTRDAVWVDFQKASGGEFAQILVGFVPGATDGTDRLYDAHDITGRFYIRWNDQNWTINALSAWDGSERRVPLGFNAPADGNYTISLNRKDGALSGVNVYLIDHDDESLHALDAGPYTFHTGQGTFNDRFELVFSAHALDAADVAKQPIRIDSDGKGLFTLYAGDLPVTGIQVYDISGKLVWSGHWKQTVRARVDLRNQAHGTYIFKIRLKNTKILTRKVLR
ncbi:MAG: hypothetical protein GXO24_01060 [Chlorobi bacterium]|nr:hypothetical protein [Chlorobiota bacterium]